mmetsp:Transcript_22014/g.41722  ORF Transcript_22014/g.41722 Transcript_22014/m.41722 type:complete len:422 (-) Transcript_22014:96-1361(-)|eukprot:scaffold1924_cov218-Amphora_coffeaeformis.AAC.12
MAGEYVAGLSGGQRKLFLFELVRQRVTTINETVFNDGNNNNNNKEGLLICLDEPFAGVTDDFVPFIRERLEKLRQKHNILLVTNDHVDALVAIADNIITVSAIDRKTVRVNDRPIPRDLALAALSVGKNFQYDYRTKSSLGLSLSSGLKFFIDVEILSNRSILGLLGFSLCMFALFLISFWNSQRDNASLVLIGGEIITFYSLNPYLLSAVDWRNRTKEEAQALLHASSVESNLFWRTCLTLLFNVAISTLEYLVVVAVVDGLNTFDVWYAINIDNLSTNLPLILMALFTSATDTEVEIIGWLPYLLMMFLSTAYSPGSGLVGIKELRYVFPKFYFWCFVPGVEDQMEGCPASRAAMLGWMTLSSLNFSFAFLVWKLRDRHRKRTAQRSKAVASLVDKNTVEQLQRELYGERDRKYFQSIT